jgi:hypothetical protein
MFNDITELLLRPGVFKDAVDMFVERYRGMGIAAVAGKKIDHRASHCHHHWFLMTSGATRRLHARGACLLATTTTTTTGAGRSLFLNDPPAAAGRSVLCCRQLPPDAGGGTGRARRGGVLRFRNIFGADLPCSFCPPRFVARSL